MKINPYLSFKGNCREAFAFYEKVLRADVQCLLTYGESPIAAETPEAMHPFILHAQMTIDGNVIMASDGFDECYKEPQGISITLNVDTVEEAEAIYHGLSEGATITMPIAETFWARRFAALTDRFGIPWNINCEKSEF